jgi:hypothetical protein
LVKASVGKKVRFNHKEYDPEALVAHLEELRIVDEGRGEVAFKGSLYLDDVVTVLQRAVDFEGDVPERDLTGIVNRALFRAAKAGPLQPEPLLGEISRGVQDFLEKPEKEFVLATSLSGFSIWPAPSGLDGEPEVSGCRISLAPALPEHLREGHEAAKVRMRRYVFGKYPDSVSSGSGYTAAWISTMGRSVHEAAERALEALDLRRAIWNFSLNRQQWKRDTLERRPPVNRVIPGPVHSLHHPDGSLASEIDWYEHDYVEPIPREKSRERWKRAEREDGKIRKGLAASAYRDKIAGFLKRYTRALDTREWESAFVRLWGLLEEITGTRATDDHQVTVSRAAFLYDAQERDLHEQVLRHLKNYRHGSVHAGEDSEAIETYLYQLKRYVEDLMEFHLMSHPKSDQGFGSFDEAIRFLSQPTDPPAAQKKISDLSDQVRKKQLEIDAAEKARAYHSRAQDQF